MYHVINLSLTLNPFFTTNGFYSNFNEPKIYHAFNMSLTLNLFLQQMVSILILINQRYIMH